MFLLIKETKNGLVAQHGGSSRLLTDRSWVRAPPKPPEVDHQPVVSGDWLLGIRLDPDGEVERNW